MRHPARLQPVSENRARSRREPEGLPTTPHPAKSPLGLLQNPPHGRGYKLISLIAGLLARVVDCFGDLVWCMTRDVLPQRGAEDLTARALRAPRETFDLLEDVVGDGDCGFHTLSITVPCAAYFVPVSSLYMSSTFGCAKF